MSMKRTEFIRLGAAAGGALLVEAALPANAATDVASAPANAVKLNAWVKITPDDVVTIMVSQAEMGQGIGTTHPAVIAEELDADWGRVRLEQTGIDAAYNNPNIPWQFTGDAESIRAFWPVLRAMGASARDVLLRAAAARWNVDPAECRTRDGVVSHPASQRTATYGSLATAAAALTPNPAPRLKAPSEWRLLRKSAPRVELRGKVTGAPLFGIDVVVPGMVYAALKTAPTIDGDVASYDAAVALGKPGVVGVARIPRGIAVAAKTYWQARKALEALPVTWSTGPAANLSSASLDARYRATMDGDRWTTVVNDGNARETIAAARSAGAKTVSAEYVSAWQAHATMEPMNCTASVSGDRCTLWAPTQGQTACQVDVAKALGIPKGNVAVNRTFLGGGFGRRLIADYAVHAALISKSVGRPVKAIWSREEDLRRDTYRPAFWQTMSATLDAQGLPAAIDQRVVAPTILSPVVVGLPKPFAFPQIDPSCLEGLSADLYPYAGPRRLDFHLLDVPVPTMVWRTTGYGPNIFALESFVDELAAAADIDPYRYRLALLRGTKHEPRAVPVLAMLAEKADLVRPRPRGTGVGIAFAYCFQTYIAQAIEVSVSDDALDIHRVVTVLDGGYVLNPDITRANIEGGVNWGLTQALVSEITFAHGASEATNFDRFKILALPELPKLDFFSIDSGADPGGLGEVGPVPTTPALANAIFAASGRRIRTLPIARHGLRTRYARGFAERETWSA
jgi:isoquinoline 1-oxidoreductase beta subunit